MQSVTKLGGLDDSTPDTNDLDGWVVRAGSPAMKTWVLHTNADGTMVSGYW